MIDQFIKAGAEKVVNPRYPGTWYNIPGLGGFGTRTKPSSKSAIYGTNNTIDLEGLGLEIKKLKY